MSSQSCRVVSLVFPFAFAGLLAGGCSQQPQGPGGDSGTGGSSAGSTGGKTGNNAGTGGSTASGGSSGSGGASGGSSGGNAGTGGSPGTGGAGPAGTGGSTPDAGGSDTSGPATTEKFSFFVTSLEGMQRLSKSQKGFGGDLRYGTENGLTGADKICTELAEGSMPGAGAKGWRAFLSSPMGPEGKQVDAIDRVGEGPWYDRKGRLVAMTKAALINTRPQGADSAILNDLPNEYGIGNHRPDPTKPAVDNHHVLTGSNTMGRLNGANSTCNGWQVLTGGGRPRIGFSWPAGGREHWISGQDEGGCGAGVNVAETGGSDPSNPIVGSGGGYGGIYCFALKP
jgi:hypothetical protein